MVRYVIGDATKPRGAKYPAAIVHIVNDIGRWGAGFTRSLSVTWPLAEMAYREWSSRPKPNSFNPGRIQAVPMSLDPALYVVNMVAQRGIRSASNPRPLNLDDLGAALKRTVHWSYHADIQSIHMPRIGCGLAGGTWDEIEPMLHFPSDVDVCVYERSTRRLR